MTTNRDKAQLYHDLAAMEDAGMILTDALRVCSVAPLRKSLDLIISAVRTKSQTLSLAMRQQPKIFTQLECEIIQLGEQTGKLTPCFKNLNKWFSQLHAIQTEIKTGLIYPAIIIHAAPLLLGLPELAKSSSLTSYVLGVIATLAPIYVVFFAWVYLMPALRKSNKSLAALFDRFILKIPILGKVNYNLNMSRFTLALSYSLDAGVDIYKSLNLACVTTNNIVIRKDLEMIAKHIRTGKSFAESIRAIKTSDAFVEGFISVGEQTGKQVEMLEKLYEYYFDSFKTTLKRLMKIAPVVLLISIALFAAYRIISAYKDLWDIPV